MRSTLVPCLLLAFAAGCPADPEPGDTNASSTASDSSTSTDPDGCGTAGCCGQDVCDTADSSTSGMPPTTSSDSTSSDTTGTETDGTATETSGTPSCEFGPLLAGFAEGKSEPVDCGTITLADDAATWAAAAECAAGIAAMQEAFFVAFEQPSIDSLIYDGYYGSVGFTYALGRLYSDTLALPPVTAYTCADLVIAAGCDPGVGEHCLECVGASEPTEVECIP